MNQLNMKQIGFDYTVKVIVELSRSEAEIIFSSLENHPDTKVYTKQGGFAFSFINFFKPDDFFEYTFTTKNLDLILKSFELNHYFTDEHQKEIIFLLRNRIVEIVKNIKKEYYFLDKKNK